jgi:excisionase family DNA binding protein
MNDDKLMNTKEIADYLNVAVSTILFYRSAGTGPKFIKVGRLVRYRKSVVDEWLANN